eukprot:TRINITY_DN12510_c0_g2_i1.p1 TRINITY_DN12510_c0_g2~~TRINITY_DN12510_c0_g2_i1.p1  ORF type:complete len:328 (-),score=38.26 TRINITY_DN12510_c0_g2_i1:193-1080(-)
MPEWMRVSFTALLTLLVQRLWRRLMHRRCALQDRAKWDAKEDLGNLQACLLSTINLSGCGRVEKRTILTKPLEHIFSNEYVRNLILDAASKCTDEEPFVCSHLPMEDRWQVLIAVQSHLSSVFGPYHLFADQTSSYNSCWYVFTLVGTRTSAAGRFFVTPQHPLSPENDVGAMRIRVVLVSEQEIRKIASGEIAPMGDLFSARHAARWDMMEAFAGLFENQLKRVRQASKMTGAFDLRSTDSLCGPSVYKVASRTNVISESKEPVYNNTFLRIHIPVPLIKETKSRGPQEVVLYE